MAEFEALTEPGKTASTIAFGGDKPPNYSFFATPTASDASADAPFSLSAFGESKTLDVAASDLPTVAGKTVDSVESTAVDPSDTAASSAEGSDVHDLGATSAPYFSSDPSGLQTQRVSPRQTIRVTQVSPQRPSPVSYTHLTLPTIYSV